MLTLSLLIGAVCLSGGAAFNYCSLSAQNTLCLYSACTFSTRCKQPVPITLTAAHKSSIVSSHNSLRDQIAQGGADYSYLRGPSNFPSASNMRQMSWDDELAVMAQAWANQCIIGKDSNRDVARFQVGQSTVRNSCGAEDASSIDAFINQAVPGWKRYVSNFQLSDIDAYGSIVYTAEFARMIWADTFKIGCAMTSFIDDMVSACTYHLVCNYGPAGATPGQRVYKIGPPASACPNGTSPAGNFCA